MGSAALIALTSQHTFSAGIRLVANGCVCLCGAGERKNNTPQNQRLGKKKEAHPRAKHQHRSNKTTAQKAGEEV